MMNNRIVIIGLMLVLLGGSGNLVIGQESGGQGKPGAGREIPWPMMLGLRVRKVERALAVVDRVVLVPDAATYLDELGKWSPQGRWPVLIEDGVFAPMFVRRFGAAEVIRRESVGALPRGEQLADRMRGVVIKCFDGPPEYWEKGNSGAEILPKVFGRLDFRPAGVVLTSVHDAAWTAAVALAAGRGQPLVWLEGQFGNPNGGLTSSQARGLRKKIDGLVEGCGFPVGELGEGIDTITLCRRMASRVKVGLPQNQIATKQGKYAEGPLSLTDWMGRRESGERYAYAGWIFGDEARCAYVAMCSLFLQQTDIQMFNAYDNSGGFKFYGMDEAAEVFEGKGYGVNMISGGTGGGASPMGWLRMVRQGLGTDVMMVNTSGNAFCNLKGGKVYPDDMPILNQPTAVHFIQSWSMKAPESERTIAGKWLNRGAYAFVGAVYEPYLGAFVPPSELAKRWMSYVPFLVGSRQWVGPMGRPWRICTYGDPLMLAYPALEKRVPRVKREAEYGVALKGLVAGLVKEAQGKPKGDAAVRALALMDLLGKDKTGAAFWSWLVQNEGGTGGQARAALAMLFRRGEGELFMQAWERLPKEGRGARERDMLWHLWGPQMGSIKDENVLLVLEKGIRETRPDIDIERLGPHLERAFGRRHVRGLIEREQKKLKGKYLKREFEKLRGKYR